MGIILSVSILTTFMFIFLLNSIENTTTTKHDRVPPMPKPDFVPPPRETGEQTKTTIIILMPECKSCNNKTESR